MKKRKSRTFNEIKNDFNKCLEMNNQKIRVVIMTKTTLIFNNGIQLNGRNRRLFYKMLERNSCPLWRESIDYILEDFDARYEEIRKHISSVTSSSIMKKNILSGKLHPELNGCGRIPWNKGKHYHRVAPFSAIERLHHSQCKLGSKNPMYGKHHTEECKLEHSKRIKDKILNGEFTPNTNNRYTHYDVKFDGKTFRSSWEALFYYTQPDYEYEKLRIPYMFENKQHIYIVDFINYKSKIVVEIKPKDILNRSIKDKIKIEFLKEWCKQNGFTFQLKCEDDIKYLVQNTDISVFDESTQRKLLTLLGN